MDAGPAKPDAAKAAKSHPDPIIPPKLRNRRSQVFRLFLNFLSEIPTLVELVSMSDFY